MPRGSCVHEPLLGWWNRSARRCFNVRLQFASQPASFNPCKQKMLLDREQVKGDEEEIYKVVAALEELCVNK